MTSDSSLDAYVVTRVVMSTVDDYGLYEIALDNAWSLVESGLIDAQWVEVYLYEEMLGREASRSALGSSVTMKDISKVDYGTLEDLNISMVAYAVGTDNEEMENAWRDIKAHRGL